MRGTSERGGAETADFWRELGLSFVTPSPPALGTAAVVLAAGWLLLAASITPELVAEKSEYFAADRMDYDAFVTGRVQGLARRPSPTVVLLGASGMRLSVSRVEHIEEHLSRRLGGSHDVMSLVTDGQSWLETLALVEELPESFGGLIVVDVNPSRLHVLANLTESGRYEYRLGFRNRVFEDANAPAGIVSSTSVYFWDNRLFFLPRMSHVVANLWSGPPEEFVRAAYNAFERRDAPQLWDKERKRVQNRVLPGCEAHLRGFLETLVQTAGEHASRLVLLETPLSARGRRELYGADRYELFRSRSRSFAEEHAISYWDLAAEAELGDEDFIDWVHVGHGDARRRYTRVLSEALVARFSEGDAVSPAAAGN